MYRRHSEHTERLEFVAASLDDEASGLDAAAGCDGIFHVASPVPTIQPKDPNEVIEPARIGTLNVLNAAKKNGIERVVLTSSLAAVLGGISEPRLYTSADWSDPDDPHMKPYSISKTIAERAAWDYCKQILSSRQSIQRSYLAQHSKQTTVLPLKLWLS